MEKQEKNPLPKKKTETENPAKKTKIDSQSALNSRFRRKQSVGLVEHAVHSPKLCIKTHLLVVMLPTCYARTIGYLYRAGLFPKGTEKQLKI